MQPFSFMQDVFSGVMFPVPPWGFCFHLRSLFFNEIHSTFLFPNSNLVSDGTPIANCPMLPNPTYISDIYKLSSHETQREAMPLECYITIFQACLLCLNIPFNISTLILLIFIRTCFLSTLGVQLVTTLNTLISPTRALFVTNTTDVRSSSRFCRHKI